MNGESEPGVAMEEGGYHRLIAEASGSGYCIIDVKMQPGEALDYRFLEVNQAFEQQTSLQDPVGRWMREMRPAHEEFWFETYRDVALTGGAIHFEHEARALDRWYDVHAFRVGRPEQRRVGVLFADIGPRKRAEAALREANERLEARVAERTAELRQTVAHLHAEVLEREQAEAALRQSQKMEAVGQLTGGIAHDFNNMLQGIGGSLELVERRIGQGRQDEALRFVRAALQSVQRAGALTHRLLAFARRQALDPKPAEPDALIRGMEELIGRTVGPSIEVVLRMGDGVWTVLCDAGQLENVLLNLAINARDAMPQGGRLTIETTDVALSAADLAAHPGVPPGDYAEISVADTGHGMDEATKARAFEPFFTTKPLGQGTGLGLSQAYGFVRQSEGIIRLDSAPGQGTTVRLYLPRHVRSQRPQPAAPEPEPLRLAACGVVLLVEDEAGVRTIAAEALRELGCAVLEAKDGASALNLLASGLQVDLLVTDVGLPGGINGRQMAEAARGVLASLPVLFITGYSGGALEGQMAAGMEVLAKPFTLAQLAARVEGMLKGQREK